MLAPSLVIVNSNDFQRFEELFRVSIKPSLHLRGPFLSKILVVLQTPMTFIYKIYGECKTSHGNREHDLLGCPEEEIRP